MRASARPHTQHNCRPRIPNTPSVPKYSTGFVLKAQSRCLHFERFVTERSSYSEGHTVESWSRYRWLSAAQVSAFCSTPHIQ